ncbi:MAG: DUF58 domain-containing protein [Candidatus Methanofastidiosia archaeon]
MYTPKFLYGVFLVIVLFVVAVQLQIPTLLFVLLPVITYVILSSTGCRYTTVTVRRAPLPEYMMAGDQTDITLTISANGEPPHLMEVKEKISTAKDGYFISGTKKEVSLQYERTVNRGFMEIGPVRIRIENFSRTVFYDFEYPDKNIIAVLPTVHPVPVKMSARLTTALYGPVPAKRAGIGETFYALREYLPGDEYKSINWKATARRGYLITNEYEAERVSEAIIVVDAGQHTNLGQKKSLLDYELEAAASVARVLLSEGHRVGLFVYSDYFHWVTPGTTTRHFVKILDVFSAITPAGKHRMQYVARYIAAHARKGSQIIIVSSMEDSKAAQTVEALTLMGHAVLVVSPSPESIEWTEIPHDQYTQIAYNILSIKREAMFADLNAFCDAIDWDVTIPLEDVLTVMEKWLRKRRR